MREVKQGHSDSYRITFNVITPHYSDQRALIVSDLGVGLRLCKLNLEIKHLCGRLLLQLCGGFLLAGQLSVHLLHKHRGTGSSHRNMYDQTICAPC